ncbi:E3 ubiquitin/ISG15 ligase TRIM25-like [Tachysurus fulvidraco]|uniref:E3 ubiquitin/ISG15 ligase TRIM25-like n=1 Tax=Tachysurus fulvidraco TaxID=1234273 RepID=UPI001FEE37E8|nr:E3 ubiquitin/ISG15 ligase TRIM25-like [Tachysurus fulvidraco]
MTESSISVDHFSVHEFSCPVCLDLLNDPVTTSCGHSFCKVCINTHWDQEDVNGVYRCPQCRETFTPRPVLRRNDMLAEVVKKLKKTELQAASPAHCYAGPGDVECDSCTGRKHKAVKSCLVCQASYCEDHLKPHYQSPAFKKHKLVEACEELQEKICSEHDKLMEIYCRTDQSLICYLCMMEEHKGHDTVSAKAERTKNQNELKEDQIKSHQRIQEKQKKVEELKQTVDIIKIRSQAAVDDSERIFTEMINSMFSEVMELIRAQEKDEVSRAERLLNQLEQEITDLKRRVTELEQLSHTHDDIHFLQSFPSLCVSPGCDDSPSFTVNQHLSFDGVRKSLSDLKNLVEQICEEEFNIIRPQAAAVQIILPSEPKTREDFLQYFCYLTLDPNTAHPELILSEKNRVVRQSETQQRYFDHPERFDAWTQVLCKESVCGRCYWEVERRGDVYISVSYKEISRKGRVQECLFGHNSQSWSLWCSSSVFFWHNSIHTKLRGPSSSRIGVYVDHSAGTLSFYSVSNTMRLLHRVHTTFTQTLYAGFRMLSNKSSVRICDPK